MKKVLYIFGQLNDNDIEWLITNGKKETVKAGTVLIRNKQKIEKLYICLQGMLSILIGKKDNVKIAELGSGEIVGEMSFVDLSLPSATVKAEVDSFVYSIERDKLMLKINEDEGFAKRFYHAIAIFLSDRLRTTSSVLGYGDLKKYKDIEIDVDELNPLVIDNVAIAGDRFTRMLDRMMRR